MEDKPEIRAEVPEQLYEKLRRQKERTGIPISSLVRQAVVEKLGVD